MPAQRKIIRIDEKKCDGCGLCVGACHEGAIQIVDGKAKLVSESYCDGLGDCLAECPQGAITIEEREAEPFDEAAVQRHLKLQAAAPVGCPGSLARMLTPDDSVDAGDAAGPVSSKLRNWPVQLHLVPVTAPYLSGAKLTLAADCAPFAYADFHRRFIADRVVINACPKLDDAAHYVEKLTEMVKLNDIAEIEIPYMEVPCCGGLVRIIGTALEQSGKSIPVTLTKIGIRGEILESRRVS